jgi:hypothetical protein
MPPVSGIGGRVQAPSCGTCLAIIARVICVDHGSQIVADVDQRGCDLFRLAGPRKTVLPFKLKGVAPMGRSFNRLVMGGDASSERRASPRTQLLLPAKLVCVYDTLDCMVLDLSEVGAFVKMANPLSVGASAYLRAGPFDIFAVGVRIVSYSRAYALNGVAFDNRLSQDQIMNLQSHARDWVQVERRREYQAARQWWHSGGE